MTNWYEGVDNVVAGTALTMASADTLYVKAGVTIGSSGAATGVFGADSIHAQIFGAIISLGADAMVFSGGANEVTIGMGGSLSAGSSSALLLTGAANHVVNNGSITGDYGIVTGTGGDRIVNTGTISAVQFGLNLAGTGDIVSNYGTITGTTAISIVTGTTHIFNGGQILSSLTAINLVGGNNNFTNTGTVSSAGGFGIAISSVTGDAQNTIYNSGTIASGGHGAPSIATGDADAFIGNSGMIMGTIAFGAGNDTYDGSLGRIFGTIEGGDGDDVLIGGAGRDVLYGAEGMDTIEGGNGRDKFFCFSPSESLGDTHDTVVGFDAREDKFLLGNAVTGIDATVTVGMLRSGHFAKDVAAAVDAAHLLAGHAVLFKPNSGDLAGHTILVVDANGHAGYQLNNDYVFDLVDPSNLTAFGVGDFG